MAPGPVPVPEGSAVLDPAVPRDLVLFRHDRTRFFRLLRWFCAGQGLFWAYLAHFAFTKLRPPPPGTGTGTGTEPEDPLRPRDNKWRFGFTASCLTIGSLVLAAGSVLPLRWVQRVTLLRGGLEVSLGTGGPLGLGRGRALTVPLRHVSCHAHRREARGPLPLKVKGHVGYFLLDAGGEMLHPRLFDVTVGAYRKL